MRWEGADALTPGMHTLELDFKYDGIIGFATLAFNKLLQEPAEQQGE